MCATVCCTRWPGGNTPAFVLPRGTTGGYVFFKRRHVEAISVASAAYRGAAPGGGGCRESARMLSLPGCRWKSEGEGRHFPKIMLRPHFKKEKPNKAFGGRGEQGRRSGWEWNEGCCRGGARGGRTCSPGVCGQRQGECSWPEGGVGHRGRLLPCVGLGEDRTKDRVRGRHRRRMKALPGPKRGLDSIWFAR